MIWFEFGLGLGFVLGFGCVSIEKKLRGRVEEFVVDSIGVLFILKVLKIRDFDDSSEVGKVLFRWVSLFFECFYFLGWGGVFKLIL